MRVSRLQMGQPAPNAKRTFWNIDVVKGLLANDDSRDDTLWHMVLVHVAFVLLSAISAVGLLFAYIVFYSIQARDLLLQYLAQKLRQRRRKGR